MGGSNAFGSELDKIMDEILEFFRKCEHWVPIVGPVLGMLVDIPEGKELELYDLADAYGRAAQLHLDHLNDVMPHLNDLYTYWQGDGAAAVAAEQLQGYVQQLSSDAEAFSGMEKLVHGTALSIEATKMMDIVNLVMLAVATVEVIMTIIETFGLSSIGEGVAIATCRQAIKQALKELIDKIIAQGWKGALKAILKAALKRGWEFAKFTLESKIGVMAFQEAEGHDPMSDFNPIEFAGELANSFLTGFIGGPLAAGAHTPLSEGLSMAIGQIGDNYLKLLQDDIFDKLGLTKWAQDNGLYTNRDGFNPLTDGVGTAALFGGVMGAKGMREGLRDAAADIKLNMGETNALGDKASMPTESTANETLPENQGQVQTGDMAAGQEANQTSTSTETQPSTETQSSTSSETQSSSATDTRSSTSSETQSSTSSSSATDTRSSTSSETQSSSATDTKASTSTETQSSTASDTRSSTETQSSTETPSSTATDTRAETSNNSTTTTTSEPGRTETAQTSDQTQVADRGTTTETTSTSTDAKSDVQSSATDTKASTDARSSDATSTSDATKSSDATRSSTDATKSDTPSDTKSDTTRADATKADGTKADATKADGTKADGTKADDTKTDTKSDAKSDATKTDAKSDAKSDATKSEASKADSGKDSGKGDGDKGNDQRGGGDKNGHDHRGGDKSGNDKSGDGKDPGKDNKPRWREYARRVQDRLEARYGKEYDAAMDRAMARRFEGDINRHLPGGRDPAKLTADTIQRVIDRPDGELDPYGQRFKSMVENHFTEHAYDANGDAIRRPIGPDAIADQLKQMSNSHAPPHGLLQKLHIDKLLAVLPDLRIDRPDVMDVRGREPDLVIHSDSLPEGDYHGRGRTFDTHGVREEANNSLKDVIDKYFKDVKLDDKGGSAYEHTLRVKDATGSHDVKIKIDAKQMNRNVVGESELGRKGWEVTINSGTAPEHVARTVAHELSEILTHEDPALRDKLPIDNLLNTDVPSGDALSAHDVGRIAEMVMLRDMALHGDATAGARLGEMVDHMGLRDGPGGELRRDAVTKFLDDTASHHLNNDMARQLSDLFKGPAEDLPKPPDVGHYDHSDLTRDPALKQPARLAEGKELMVDRHDPTRYHVDGDAKDTWRDSDGQLKKYINGRPSYVEDQFSRPRGVDVVAHPGKPVDFHVHDSTVSHEIAHDSEQYHLHDRELTDLDHQREQKLDQLNKDFDALKTRLDAEGRSSSHVRELSMDDFSNAVKSKTNAYLQQMLRLEPGLHDHVDELAKTFKDWSTKYGERTMDSNRAGMRAAREFAKSLGVPEGDLHGDVDAKPKSGELDVWGFSRDPHTGEIQKLIVVEGKGGDAGLGSAEGKQQGSGPYLERTLNLDPEFQRFLRNNPDIVRLLHEGKIPVEYYKVTQPHADPTDLPSSDVTPPDAKVRQFNINHGDGDVFDPRHIVVDRTITASEVPDSNFHGHGRTDPAPEVVEHGGHVALDHISTAPDSPLHVQDGKADLTTEGGQHLKIDLKTAPADSLPDDAAARSVPVDAHGNDLPAGTVPPDGGGYRIELSEQLSDMNIERAVRHEIAEISEIHARAEHNLPTDIPDALRSGNFGLDSEISPHDAGRIAELNHLAMEARDPALRDRALAEFRALRDHLGLRPDEPGMVGRRSLINDRLSPEAHSLLDTPPHELSTAHAPGEAASAHEPSSHEPSSPSSREPTRYEPRADDMLKDPTDDQLRELGVGEATWEDLGYPNREGLSPEEVARYEQSLPQTALVRPEEIRFTQRSVSANDLSGHLAEEGWRGGPIHGVRWGDGSLDSLDNRRLRAAQEVRLDKIPLTVHAPHEPLTDWPHEWSPDRIAKNALRIDIRELPDGRLVVGGDEGVVKYHAGDPPKTWGEIALFRAAEQRSLLPGRLWGAEEPPVTIGKPPEIEPPSVAGEIRSALETRLASVVEPANAAMRDLQKIGNSVSERLNVHPPIELRGADDRIKGLDSLVRKYHDEGRLANKPVDEFLREVNDLARFSMRMPDGPSYKVAFEETLNALRAEHYEVTDVKNFWGEGNRYLGMNVTVRSPHDGRPMEIQFPTDDAWRANKLTHKFYEVFREPGGPNLGPDEATTVAVRRVHSILNTLAANKEVGLLHRIPPGLDDAFGAAKDTTFSKWVSKDPSVWTHYTRWLADNGRSFGDIMREFGLTKDDFPIREELARDLGKSNAELLRDLQARYNGASDGAADGNRVPRQWDRGRDDLGSHAEGVGVRPGTDHPVSGRLPEPGQVQDGGSGHGGGGDAGGDGGQGGAAGRGDHPLDLSVEGESSSVGRSGVEPTGHGAQEPPGGGGHRAEPGGHSGTHRDPFGEQPRSGLLDRIRTRIGNLFHSGEDQGGGSHDPGQALRERAERDNYEATIRSAQHSVRNALESEPEIRKFRQDAHTAWTDEQQARADAATHRAEAASGRADETSARDQARQYREYSDQLAADDPNRDAFRQAADQWEQHADQRGADAQRAENQANQDEQRIADAHRRLGEANRQADELTKQARTREADLWKWANREVEQQFEMVGPRHPGPEVSALTGRDVPPPVWRNRPYGVEHGLREVLHSDQVRLERALSNGQGGFERTPDPKGSWLRLLNAFGIPADPTRTQNCNDTMAAFYDTYVHGRPTVAAPRTFDGYTHGDPNLPFGGEGGGPGRMEDLTGGRYQALVGDSSKLSVGDATARVNAGFDQLRQQLLAGGHGSFGSIITAWRGGSSHAWGAVNHEGVVHFVDVQSDIVVVAVDHPSGGVQFIDARTGTVVNHPIYDPARITAMDALVVDGNATPMPFADRPPGAWNDRPLTQDYLAHQPPDEQAAQSATASNGAAHQERQQAASDAHQATEARKAEQRFATDAQQARTQAQDAANRAATHVSQRDAAWSEADRRSNTAQQHEAATRAYAEQGQADLARQHQAAAQQARAEEAQLRTRAYDEDRLRQQAELVSQRATETSSNLEIRRQDASQSAQAYEQSAQAHEQRASQLESRYSQEASRAANEHHQQADRYRAEAQQRMQAAAQRAVGDPVRTLEEQRAQHLNRLADAAVWARHEYGLAHQHGVSAEQHDQRAAWYDRQANDAWQRATHQDWTARNHEQARIAATERARQFDERAQSYQHAADQLRNSQDPAQRAQAEQYRQAAEGDRQAAQRDRDQAADAQRQRDAATRQAHTDRLAAQSAEQSAKAERTAATVDRNEMNSHHDKATRWHRSLRYERTQDPGARRPAPEFRPDNLGADLRGRYDALGDENARHEFAEMYKRMGGNEHQLTGALDKMETRALGEGRSLEEVLADRYAPLRPPAPEVLHEIEAQRQHILQLRDRIDDFARRHPEIQGVEKWQRTLGRELAPLDRESRGLDNPSIQRALDHGNNVRSVQAEIDLAEQSSGVIEVGKEVSAKTPDGTVHRTDVDVLAENGEAWKDAKNYHPFGLHSSDFVHAREQVERQLKIIAYGTEYHVGGRAPRLEWHFPRGVDPEVARALEAIRITDPVSGRELPFHVTVTGDRIPYDPSPAAPGAAPGGAGHAPGGGGHPSGGGLDPVEAARAHKIDLALGRIGDEFGTSAHGDFVDSVSVARDGLVTVTPRSGDPYEVRIKSGDAGDDLFKTTVRADEVREVTVSPDLIDGRRGIQVDATVARALGHVSGEVAAEARGNRLAFLRRDGGHNALVSDVDPPKHQRLSGSDLARVGEYQALSRLRDNITGPVRSERVDQEIGRFIERHGLREGLPGADERLHLVNRYLSEPARAMLDEYRVAGRDSDPAMALGRQFFSAGRSAHADLEPLGLGGKDFHNVFRVKPDDWARQGRVSFTVEVESGHPADGKLVEIRGTDLKRHFRVIVERDLLDGRSPTDPAVRIRLGSRIEEALNHRIDLQERRPPEISSWRVRWMERGASAAAGGAAYEVADRLGSAPLTYRALGGVAADILTAGHFSKHTAVATAEAAHERALARALRVDPVTGQQLETHMSGLRGEINDLAEDVGLDRSELHWTPDKAETAQDASTAPIPDDADASLRERLDQLATAIAGDANGVEAIKHALVGDGYKVVVGDGPNVRVHVKVGVTPNRDVVEFDGQTRTLTVSPELLRADDHTLQEALKAGFEKVATHQFNVGTRATGQAWLQVKNLGLDLAQQGSSLPLSELVKPHSGEINAEVAGFKKLAEVVTSPVTNERTAELAQNREEFDSSQLDRAVSKTTTANSARGTTEAAENLGRVARYANFKAEHGVEPDPRTLGGPRLTGDPMHAAHQAVAEVDGERGGKISVVHSDGDPTDGYTGGNNTRYQIEISGHNKVRLDVTVKSDLGTDTVAKVVRTGWGKFEVQVRPDAEPDLVHKVVRIVAEDIIDRRGEGIPSIGEFVLSKGLPASVGMGTGIVMFTGLHSAPALALSGVVAAFTGLGGVRDYLQAVHTTDKLLERTFAGLDVKDVFTADVRTEMQRTTVEVESFEQRVAGELRTKLDELTQARQAHGLTDVQRDALDQRIERVHHELADLSPTDAALLTPLHTDLPKLPLPHHGTVSVVDAEQHVFRLSYDRGGIVDRLGGGGVQPRSSLAFDVVSGEVTGPGPIEARFTNSDTEVTVVVDPHASPTAVRQALHEWLTQAAVEGQHAPTGIPGGGSRAVGLLKDAAGVAASAGVGVAMGPSKFAASLAANVTTAVGTMAGAGGRMIADTGLGYQKAGHTFDADLAANLRSGKATPQQLMAFQDHVRYLAGRFARAHAVHEWLADLDR